MNQIVKAIFASVFLFGTALAEDLTAWTPTEMISDGYYSSLDPYFVNVEISPWADEHIIKGVAKYGDYNFPFKVRLSKNQGNNFSGMGNIQIRFNGGAVCNYKFGVKIKTYVEGIFISSNEPSSLPASYPGYCLPPGPYVWVDHSEIYEMLP